jgi:hypothetical protein
MTDRVILQCIKDKSKLRIRFHSFIDKDNKEYYNMYNTSYNCQFPREIRKEGRFYEIPSNAISLIASGNKKPFYKIAENEIKILGENTVKEKEIVVFDQVECVICLSNNTEITYLPCGHKCVCSGCNKVKICPLCRIKINSFI